MDNPTPESPKLDLLKNWPAIVINVLRIVLGHYAKLKKERSDAEARLVIQKKFITEATSKRIKYKEESLDKYLSRKTLVSPSLFSDEIKFVDNYNRRARENFLKKQQEKFKQKMMKATKMKTLLVEIAEGKSELKDNNKKINDLCKKKNKQLPRKRPLGGDSQPTRAIL